MSRYQITLITQDQQQLNFTCSAEQSLQEAAEAEHIFLPSQCRNGVCGVCTLFCQSGEFEMHDYNRTALSDEQRQQGEILLCRTYPRSDLELRSPYPHALIKFASIPQRDAEVVACEPVTDAIVMLHVQLLPDADGNISLDFQAGQFVELKVPETGLSRAYSLANAPNWDGRLEFLIQLHEQGEFSQFLRGVQAGQMLKVIGPQGLFVLKESSLATRYLVAGGTGLAPCLAMLRQMADFGEAHPVELFIGVYHETDLCLTDTLNALQQQLPQLKIHRCISHPQQDWQAGAGEWKNAHRASVVEVLGQALTASSETVDIYLCGSANLVRGVSEIVKQVAPASKILHEAFTPSH